LVHGSASIHVSNGTVSLQVAGNDGIVDVYSLDQLLDLVYEIAHLHGRLYFTTDSARDYPPLPLSEKSALQAFSLNNPPRSPMPVVPTPPPRSPV
jgi:hypothetical protein